MMRALAFLAALAFASVATAQSLTGGASGWVAFTPVLSCSNSHAPSSVTATGYYQQTGKFIAYQASVTITNAGTCANGDLLFLGSLPFVTQTVSTGAFQSPTNGRGGTFAMPSAANYGTLAYSDGTWAGATGTVINLNGTAYVQ